MASFVWKRKIGEKVSKVTSQQFEAQAADEQVLVDNSEVDWLHEAKRKKGLLLEDCEAQSKHLKDEGAILAENGRYQEALHKWDEALQLTPEDATLYEMKSQVLMSLHEMFPAVQAAEMAVQRDPHSWEAWQTLGRAQLGLGEITLELKIAFTTGLGYVELNFNMPSSNPILEPRTKATNEYFVRVSNWIKLGRTFEKIRFCITRVSLKIQPTPKAIRSFQIALHIYPLNTELWNEDLSWAKKLQQQKKATKTETGTQGAEAKTLEEPIPDYDFESDEILAVCAAIAEKEKSNSTSKSVVIVSASGTVETVTEQEESATVPDGAVFIKAR